MKNTGICPKCGSHGIVRVPDHPSRHASGNNIYTSTVTLLKKSLLSVMSAVTADMWKTGWRRGVNWRRSGRNSPAHSLAFLPILCVPKYCRKNRSD